MRTRACLREQMLSARTQRHTCTGTCVRARTHSLAPVGCSVDERAQRQLRMADRKQQLAEEVKLK
jgi:hypothetical protein